MTTYKKTSGRQQTVIAYADFDYSQLVSGTFKGLIELPPNAVLEGGLLVVDTAWNSATSDVAVVGDSGTTNRYKASASIAATGAGVLVPTGKICTSAADRLVGVVWTGVSTAPSAGAARLSVSYYVRGRAQFAQGLDN